MSNLDIPFFFDRNLSKNFKIFGQVLYIYFDPTFRRHVSVIDIGLKQKSTIFVDDIFKNRNYLGDNNFQFLFLKKKDTFSLKPVHFLNSKNERALKKRYLSFYDRKFSFLKLNRFSFLVFSNYSFEKTKNENLFNFKNENLLNFMLLKSFSLTKTLQLYKVYALTFLNFLKNSKKLKHKLYKAVMFLFHIHYTFSFLLNFYKSLLRVYYIKNHSYLKFFLAWYGSFRNEGLKIFLKNQPTPKVVKFFNKESNNFFRFNSETELLKGFSMKNKLKKDVSKNLFRNLKSSRRSLLLGLNENSNLFSVFNLKLNTLNKLEFSFKPNNQISNSLKFNFMKPLFDTKAVSLLKKLKTRNYYSILTKGKAYALVNNLSFLNLFSYSGLMRKRIFKGWLKFLIYFEKLNYLIILNNEEVSYEIRKSPYFFYSIYFPLIFNFRNLFFNLLKFFKFFKALNNRSVFRN